VESSTEVDPVLRSARYKIPQTTGEFVGATRVELGWPMNRPSTRPTAS